MQLSTTTARGNAHVHPYCGPHVRIYKLVEPSVSADTTSFNGWPFKPYQ